MESPTGIIPEELMYREKKKDVILFLQAQAFPGDFKRRLLEGWAITVGLRLRGIDFQMVEKSGIDTP
jgi:hypothetical protein